MRKVRNDGTIIGDVVHVHVYVDREKEWTTSSERMKEAYMAFEKVDSRIDVRGQICPYPVIEIRQALKRLAARQVLEVITDYEPAVSMSVPSFCAKTGCPFEVAEIAGKAWRVLIEKNS